uniref:Uncharacterized protein n=1 Tax=Setaria italica TaxID=4555 RepID=K4A486_SETIT
MAHLLAQVVAEGIRNCWRFIHLVGLLMKKSQIL